MQCMNRSDTFRLLLIALLLGTPLLWTVPGESAEGSPVSEKHPELTLTSLEVLRRAQPYLGGKRLRVRARRLKPEVTLVDLEPNAASKAQESTRALRYVVLADEVIDPLSHIGVSKGRNSRILNAAAAAAAYYSRWNPSYDRLTLTVERLGRGFGADREGHARHPDQNHRLIISPDYRVTSEAERFKRLLEQTFHARP